MAKTAKTGVKVARLMYVLRPEVEECEDASAVEVALGRIPGFWRFRRYAA
ncbi:MAG TPA: hypothetical protein VI893_09065 [Thermoplasmata archaeon]|nr:hypothetical protein [Thermoplasmata archaeon]